MAAALLAHLIKFTCAVAPPLNRQSQGYSKTGNIVGMAYGFQTPPKITLQTPLLGMGVFSGLRALDNLVKPGQTLHSNVATATSIGRRRGNRIAPKAMFERFTEKGIKVIVFSQEEARRLGHNFVGTEHILLGLIGEGSGVAAKVLKSMGINLKDARDEVEKVIGRGSGTVHKEITFTPRAKNVMELTLEESRQLGHNYVGPEHLLLGLLRKGEGVAAHVLESLGADPSNIRKEVIRMIGSTTLEDYSTNLTKLAEEGKLDPVEGRLQQVERVIKILSRRTKNNRCLILEPGVGKTAVAEGIAQLIANGDVPETIEGKMVISLVIGLLVAGTKNREEFEERLKKLMDKIRQSTILFIDEVHTIIGAAERANISKPALDRGERCIGATTLDVYRKHIEKDPALQRKFQPVKVPEPSVHEVIQNSIERRRENRIAPKAMFERFTARAIKVLMLSRDEARRLGHNVVGTEQILLGLIGEGTGIAANVLKSMGINLKDARAEVEKIIGRGSETVHIEMPFTPRANNALLLALEQSRQLGHNYVGAEHLLLGLLREGECAATCVLESLGVEPSNIFKQAMYVVLCSMECRDDTNNEEKK